jgi:hypothetical protein
MWDALQLPGKEFLTDVKPEALTGSDMKITAFWDVKLCNLVDKCRYFRATCCLCPANISMGYHTYVVSYPRRQCSKSLFVWHG